MKRLAVLFAFTLFLLIPTSVAAAECRFVLGFKTLRDLIGPETVGECLQDEHHGDNGDGLQQTTGGLLVWRKADNWTAFTDGYRTWINGPYGLEQRFNVELLPWEAEGAIERQPWVQDGLTVLEMRAVTSLETLGKHYSQVLLALLEKERDWLPPQHQSDVSVLDRIVEMSAFDQAAVRQIVELPFLENIDVYDSDALQALRGLLLSNPGYLSQIVSRPELKDSRTETDAVIIRVVVLGAEDPEAAAAIEALSWVRDGIASTEHRSADLRDASRHEQRVVETLVSLAGRTRSVFMALVRKPWIQDQLSTSEVNLVDDLETLANWNAAFVQRVIAMPFLQTIDTYESTIVDTIRELLFVDKQLPVRVLDHPALVGGITDDHTSTIFLVIMELVAPEEVAAVRALPWIQDGVSDYELGGLQQLQLVALSSSQVLQSLTQKSWVQDGISRDEQRLIKSLYSILGWYSSSQQYEALAQRIVEMPFLDTFDGHDFLAMEALDNLHSAGDGSTLGEVLSHPKLHGGIRDDQTALVAMLPLNLQEALAFLSSQP